jgi:hypothetical protein
MDSIFIIAIVAVTLVLFVALFWKAIAKLLINSIVGLALLLVLNLVFGMGIDLSNGFIIAAVALFGLPAVGTLLLLHLGHMI